jgi:NSS family neurotransmitter:Na+ symporter
MAELLEEQRETWGTRGGFVLAAIGSAVGLGNLWKFPYQLYGRGGAAFLIPYVIAIFVIGVPMLILEFSMGHFTQRAAPNAFARGHKRFEFTGWWGIILGFVIITYYPVILAYCLSFIGFSVQGILDGGRLPWAGEGMDGVDKAKDFFYELYLGKHEGYSLGALRPNIVLMLVLAWTMMYFCIFRGVKLVDKIVWLTVPLPWLMLLVLTVNGLIMPGSMKGLAYYLNPDWMQLAKPTTWQYAFGQAFFSLSLAFGVMITYASFLHRKSDINNNAAIIAISDFATSFVAGLAVFATLGAMAFQTAQTGPEVSVETVVDGGPGLAFVAFPYALAQLPGSAWWSLIFFFTLVTLGIDSAFSITESILAAIVDKTGWRRGIVLPLMSLVGLGFGLFYTTQGGLNWLYVVADFVDGTWGIAFVGLAECIVLGWLWRLDRLRRHANERSDWKLGIWWDYLIRIFIPVVLGSLFIWSLFSDMTKKGGFIRGSDGRWILPNCVGLSIMVLAPVAAVILSFVRGRGGGPRGTRRARAEIMGRREGVIALALAGLSTALVVTLLGWALHNRHSVPLLFVSLVPAVGAVVVGGYLVQKYNAATTEASWFARWGGMLGTLDISGFIALCLIYKTGGTEVAAGPHTSQEHLSAVSYVILSVVFLLIICGLGWCFYRALSAANKGAGVQRADEVGG